MTAKIVLADTSSMATVSWCRRISLQIVVSTFSSPPGTSPKSISSSARHVTQRSSVTRATAAKRIPVVRQTTSRIVGTAARRPMVSMSD
jgi:hypothetical protein